MLIRSERNVLVLMRIPVVGDVCQCQMDLKCAQMFQIDLFASVYIHPIDSLPNIPKRYLLTLSV